MKSYYLAGVILFTLFLNFSAKGWNVISVEPKNAQGFLILKGNLPSVDFWRLSIYERTYNVNGTYSDRALEQINIVGKNYYKIPSMYMTETAQVKYMYNIEGWKRSPRTIVASDVEVQMIGSLPSWLIGDRYSCNGPTYAWAIQQNIHPSGGGSWKYFLETAGQTLPDNIHVPHYEYMYKTFFETQILYSPSMLAYYDLSWPTGYLDPFNYTQFGAPKAFKVDGSVGTYHDRTGTPLYSYVDAIIAVQKTTGPWKDYYLYTDTAVISNWSNYAMEGIILRFNNYSNIDDYPEVPLLVCASNNTSVNGVDSNNTYDNQCSEAFSDLGSAPLDSIFGNYTDCLNDYYDYTSSLHQLVFSNWNTGESVHDTTLTANDLVGPNGDPNNIRHSMATGLYSLTYTNTDGQFAVAFFELKTPFTFSIPMSSYLDVNIFPVPITQNQFNVSLEASAKLKVLYEIYDMQGTRHHKEYFDLAKGSEGTFTIRTDQPLPTGILINRFTLPDGSVKVIQTTKQ